MLEVQIRLQKNLLALAELSGEFRPHAQRHSAAALARAEHAMAYSEDIKILTALHQQLRDG
jgi:hypothetical protein